MNLSELIHEVWKDKRIRELKLRKKEVEIVAKVLVDHIAKSLLQFGKVKMQGLFTLNVKKAKGRKIANPRTGEHMNINDYYKIGLEPSKRLRKGLKDLKQK